MSLWIQPLYEDIVALLPHPTKLGGSGLFLDKKGVMHEKCRKLHIIREDINYVRIQ